MRNKIYHVFFSQVLLSIHNNFEKGQTFAKGGSVAPYAPHGTPLIDILSIYFWGFLVLDNVVVFIAFSCCCLNCNKNLLSKKIPSVILNLDLPPQERWNHIVEPKKEQVCNKQ